MLARALTVAVAVSLCLAAAVAKVPPKLAALPDTLPALELRFPDDPLVERELLKLEIGARTRVKPSGKLAFAYDGSGTATFDDASTVPVAVRQSVHKKKDQSAFTVTTALAAAKPAQPPLKVVGKFATGDLVLEPGVPGTLHSVRIVLYADRTLGGFRYERVSLRTYTPAATIEVKESVEEAVTERFENFDFGGTFTWTVPADVYQATFELYGAQGGGFVGGSQGGKGARVKATLPVTPGESFTIKVGGTPQRGAEGSARQGGFNGGGGGGFGGEFGFLDGSFDAVSGNGTGGGGASDVRRGGSLTQHRILVAAGGGGAGGRRADGVGSTTVRQGGAGGAGGGESGSIGGAGQAGTLTSAPAGGSGATRSAGGTGGAGGFPLDFPDYLPGHASPGQPGGLDYGGVGGIDDGCGGGGGGGGWYGGGGGGAARFLPFGSAAATGSTAGGGGGGTSRAPAGADIESGVREGPGVVLVSYTPTPGILPTTVSVQSSANPSAANETVVFTATVAPKPPAAGTPTGVVRFEVDGVFVGPPVTLVDGRAESSAIPLAGGAHEVRVTYLGSPQYATSANQPFTQTANP